MATASTGGTAGGTAATGTTGRRRRGGFSGWISLLMNIAMMYMAYRYFFGSTPGQGIVNNATGVKVDYHHPLWPVDTAFDLYIFTSEHNDTNITADMLESLVNFTDLRLNYDETNARNITFNLTASEAVMNGAPLYAHIYAFRQGRTRKELDIGSATSSGCQVKRVANLTINLPPPQLTSRANLITGKAEYTEEEVEAHNAALPDTISYWKPTLSLNMVHDNQRYTSGSIPPPLFETMEFAADGLYYPIVYVNEFWLMREQLYPVNATTPTLELEITYNTLSNWKYMMMLQMDQSLKFQESMGNKEGDSDEFKRMLFETNPYLLGLTLVVTLLHTVFDVLAFKNDIQFWQNQKSMEGLSIKSIFMNLFMQIVILLYLADNDTSFLILVSTGVGILIEAWKITKATDVEYSWPAGSYPRITFNDKATYVSETKVYDDLAWKYLSWGLFPLIIGYSIYSLVVDTHRGWYSWVLGSLVGSIYTFGFIMMCPQLFINYKLKSVAHLPWRTFTYKALNTFIDDLFAFIIRMPTMHRLACFRDDIVFFILLYQRWIYPVDMKRRNEFGQMGEGNSEVVDQSEPAAAVLDKDSTPEPTTSADEKTKVE